MVMQGVMRRHPGHNEGGPMWSAWEGREDPHSRGGVPWGWRGEQGVGNAVKKSGSARQGRKLEIDFGVKWRKMSLWK